MANESEIIKIQNGSGTDAASDADDADECLICFVKLCQDDKDLKTCSCSFKICGFCWYRLATSSNPKCPMCRAAYDTVRTEVKIVLFRTLLRMRRESSLGTPAASLLYLLGYFDPTLPIPTQVFSSSVVEVLSNYGLIQISPNKSKMNLGQFVKHADLRRCADKTRTVQLAMDYLQYILNAELEKINFQHIERQRRYDILKAYIPHALALWNHVMDTTESELPEGATAFFASLCDRMDQIGFYGEFHVATHAAESRFQAEFGPAHLNTLRLQADMATAEWRLGRLDESMKILLKILPLARMGPGENHWLTMNIHNELAFVLNGKGFLEDALRESTEVVRISKVLYGETHSDTLTVTRNKAILMVKMGHDAEALDIFVSIYRIQKETLGESSLAAAGTQFWIGQILLKQGKVEEALRIQLDVFQKQLNMAEADEDGLIRSAAMVAFLYRELGQYEQAVNFCLHHNKRLKITDDPTGTDQSVSRLMEVLKLETELAKAYLCLGNKIAAKPILVKVLEISRSFEVLDRAEVEKLLKICDSNLGGCAIAKMLKTKKN